MTKPTEHAIRAIFDEDAEATRNWIESQLDAEAEMIHGSSVYLEDIEYEGNLVYASVKSRGCSCCPDDYEGMVELTVDDLVDQLNSETSIADKVAAKRELDRLAEIERKEKAAKEAEERKIAYEKAELARLQTKYGESV